MSERMQRGGAGGASTTTTKAGSTEASKVPDRPRATEHIPGADADGPTDIPAKGWRQILVRAYKEGSEDNVPLLAAGVAFYSFLAIFPGLIAAVLLYGLIADPAQVTAQVESVGKALPNDAQSLLTGQLKTLASTSSSRLGFGLVVAVLTALWTASGGMANLLTAVNIAYDEKDTRGFLKQRGLALLLTLGAILFIIVAVALVAVLPAVADTVGLSAGSRLLVEVVRWAGLVVAIMVALAVVYRVGPDRDAPKLRWTSVGAITATLIWLVASLGFSLYVDNFGSYGKTYGSLAGVVVLLLWLWLTMYVVLLGAEMNAEAEQQTAKDSTQGPERPMGERNAVKADSLPG